MAACRYSLLAFAAVAAMACGTEDARAENGFIDEVRLGVLDHDTGLVGTSKEDGVDIGLEFLSRPLSSLPLGSPRLVFGGLVNSEGQTNQSYAGLMARSEFAEDALRTGDGFFLEGTVAVAWHDGKLDVTGTPEEEEWKSHGSSWGFRTGFGVGYRIDETWTVALSFHHFSNADLAQPNEGTNDVGLRIGMGF